MLIPLISRDSQALRGLSAFCYIKASIFEKDKTMTNLTLNQALENIYTSLQNENEDIDTHIAALKAALGPDNKTVEVDTNRLVQNNRQGRKMMESYFKKRGVIVTFAS